MLQFYFMSILLNALAGYMLITGDKEGLLEFKSDFSLNDDNFQLVVGILSAATGLLKILSPIEGDVPVVGDLVPGIIGILCGFLLLYGQYRNRSSDEATEQTEKIDRILVANKKIIGIAACIAAALHFLFPRVLLL